MIDIELGEYRNPSSGLRNRKQMMEDTRDIDLYEEDKNETMGEYPSDKN